MKFIEEKIGSIGPLSFLAYAHNSMNGSDITTKQRYEFTLFRATAASCRIDFHKREIVSTATSPERVVVDKDSGLSLKDVQEVVAMAEEQALKESNSKQGLPELTFQTDPPVFVVFLKFRSGREGFNFYDAALADRIAKALQHAVELCGGGSKDPF
jgi:hypothetical protein